MTMIEGTGGDKDYLVIGSSQGYLLAYKHYGFKEKDLTLTIHYRLRAVPDPENDQEELDYPGEAFENLVFDKNSSTYSSTGGECKFDITSKSMDLILEEVLSGTMSEKLVKHLGKKMDDDDISPTLMEDLKDYYAPIMDKAIKAGDLSSKAAPDAVYLKHFAILKLKYPSIFGSPEAVATGSDHPMA